MLQVSFNYLQNFNYLGTKYQVIKDTAEFKLK